MDRSNLPILSFDATSGAGLDDVKQLRRRDVQDLVDRLVADGVGASTIGVTIATLKALVRRELDGARLPSTRPLGCGFPLPPRPGGPARRLPPAHRDLAGFSHRASHTPQSRFQSDVDRKVQF
jgi:hypothetical protein